MEEKLFLKERAWNWQHQFTETHLHQHYTIHLEIGGHKKRQVGILQPSHTHQRMIGGLVEIVVELIYVFYLDIHDIPKFWYKISKIIGIYSNFGMRFWYFIFISKIMVCYP